MRVLGIIPYPLDTVPGQRFRIEQWEPYLRKEHGIEFEFLPFVDAEAYRIFPKPGRTLRKIGATLQGLGRRIGELTSAGRFDAAYLYREAASIGPAILERFFAKRIPYVFDYDDAVFLPAASEANKAFAFLKFHKKTDTICRLAAHVIPGNEYLAEYARLHNPNVTVIPTTIDLDKYTPRTQVHDDVPVVGWSGSTTTSIYINEWRPVFVELAKTHRYRLRIIGAPGYDPVPGVETEVLPWVSETEVRDLKEIDIGLMPLWDDPWARGKCGLKALQYMALGTPAICSPVGVNSEIIEHGRNGFLASSKEEWLHRLREMVDDAAMRRRMGSAARETIEQSYSAQSQVPRLAEIFHSIRK